MRSIEKIILLIHRLPLLPPGYAFLIDEDGKYLIDDDGAYLIAPKE